ncbi:esterase/lipase family protein [Pseudoalteromonas denitrificans]|uniref:Lipase (Class 2) n=1 Tax=Pseudoalteromonas denitrificans DSM 6059 TaxID=1123010 RepID=A0A1I1PRY9_9GAMM|nr:lipase [Pseudoalteromonas denitrificans]SFD12447.1 hypothetical protein SAMN02745724_03564 [Pseudoalteromonas denitrificans DSM 6059]
MNISNIKLSGFLYLFALTCFNSAVSSPTLDSSYTSGIGNGWVKVDRWDSNNVNLTQESFPTDGRGDQTGQRVTFFNGDSTPHSAQFLLYYAPDWDTNTKATPVLLVHGANQDADIAWANPNEAGAYGCGRATCPSTGLMQELVDDDFKVFALSFAHKNGNGYFWSHQIADAVEVVKNETGASEVDVITWSKSAFNGRMYVSSVKEAWGVSYRGDVRRLIMLGGPNNGVDGSFRHGWTYTFTVFPACGGAINGPVANDKIICFGWWRSGNEWTYTSAYFPGASQMLKRWDSTYSLATLEQDWYTTYHGGWGVFTHSKGIDHYLSGSIVDTLRSAGTSSGVRVHNLCGDQADIALLHNEHTGPSDGVVFVDSCNDATGINNHGGSAVISVNHLELGWDTPGVSQIKTWLNAL